MQNSPVGFSYNDALGTIDILVDEMSSSCKYRNIATNPTRWPSSSTTLRRGTRGGCAASRSAGPPNRPRWPSPHVRTQRRPHRRRHHPDHARRIIGFGIDDTDTEPHQLVADIRDV